MRVGRKRREELAGPASVHRLPAHLHSMPKDKLKALCHALAGDECCGWQGQTGSTPNTPCMASVIIQTDTAPARPARARKDVPTDDQKKKKKKAIARIAAWHARKVGCDVFPARNNRPPARGPRPQGQYPRRQGVCLYFLYHLKIPIYPFSQGQEGGATRTGVGFLGVMSREPTKDLPSTSGLNTT